MYIQQPSDLIVAVLLEDVPTQVAHREEIVAQLTLHLDTIN